MVKCEVCQGRGYVQGWAVVEVGKGAVEIKLWCEKCKGQGQHGYEGAREGVGWERE